MPDLDPFRKAYNAQTDIQRALVSDIKDAADELLDLITRVNREFDPRCAHLARTRLEESVMWAVKGATGGVSNGKTA